jgi:serine/threonine protein phosphatase PrpC
LDGHGGEKSSTWLSINLVPILTKYLDTERTVENSLNKAFQEANELLLLQNFKCGSTCVSILIEEATGNVSFCFGNL